MADELFARDHERGDTPSAVGVLASLAGTGPVLELAVGTGRIAIPLAERGLEVHGVDVSPSAVDALRSKPGGEQVAVTLGDIADMPVVGAFSLVIAVFNSFFVLATQDEQVRCFANAAERLHPGGYFVLECAAPHLDRAGPGHPAMVTSVGPEQVELDLTVHRRSEQRIDTQRVTLANNGIQFFPLKLRYAWPSELDLMARLAGLELAHRWSGWRGEAFDDDSRRHVSVYQKPS